MDCVGVGAEVAADVVVGGGLWVDYGDDGDVEAEKGAGDA